MYVSVTVKNKQYIYIMVAVCLHDEVRADDSIQFWVLRLTTASAGVSLSLDFRFCSFITPDPRLLESTQKFLVMI